jgi:hypothetical protein
MNKLKLIFIAASILVAFILHYSCDSNELKYDVEIKKKITKDDPPCLQMYYYIKKYAKQYDIPLNYAFGLAYEETGYRGPFHFKYESKQISSVGAKGPMQIMLTTARWVNKDNVSPNMLLNDVEYNIKTSMKYLRMLKDRYKSWDLVFGYYNTGNPIVNNYAIKILNKEYVWEGPLHIY